MTYICIVIDSFKKNERLFFNKLKNEHASENRCMWIFMINLRL